MRDPQGARPGYGVLASVFSLGLLALGPSTSPARIGKGEVRTICPARSFQAEGIDLHLTLDTNGRLHALGAGAHQEKVIDLTSIALDGKQTSFKPLSVVTAGGRMLVTGNVSDGTEGAVVLYTVSAGSTGLSFSQEEAYAKKGLVDPCPPVRVNGQGLLFAILGGTKEHRNLFLVTLDGDSVPLSRIKAPDGMQSVMNQAGGLEAGIPASSLSPQGIGKGNIPFHLLLLRSPSQSVPIAFLYFSKKRELQRVVYLQGSDWAEECL